MNLTLTKQSDNYYNTAAFKINDEYHSAAIIRDITSQISAKAKLTQLNIELEARNEIHQSINDALSGFMNDSSPKVFLADLLNKIVKYTQSEFGFIGEVDVIDGKNVLNSFATTNIA